MLSGCWRRDRKRAAWARSARGSLRSFLPVLGYVALFLVATHSFVVLYEEPTLMRLLKPPCGGARVARTLRASPLPPIMEIDDAQVRD